MYPLKFVPVFQKRLWGGQRLRAVLGRPIGKDLERTPIGESWELADLPLGTVKADSTGAAPDGSLSSVIANGPLAGQTLHEVWTGQNQKSKMGGGENHKSFFPLLIKFLDAAQALSVQVHPDEAYARAHPGAALKSEAWYILHADPGAKIYKGVKPGVTKDQFRAALNAGAVEPLLNAIKVRTGDCYYLPSGTVHALGAGLLVAEVQTPSDTTFRVFDWNRLTADGKPRTLHIEEALACIHFGPTSDKALSGSPTPGATRLAECEHFTIDRVEVPHNVQRPIGSDMAVWIILQGQGVITAENCPPTAFARGDTLLLPPGMKGAQVKTIANAVWLEVKVPVYPMNLV
jgi:mannose-6-phosphate isomerase